MLHRDADYVTSRLVRASADGLHHASIPARAYIESRLDKLSPELQRFNILFRLWSATRAAEHGHSSFCLFFSQVLPRYFWPVMRSDPASSPFLIWSAVSAIDDNQPKPRHGIACPQDPFLDPRRFGQIARRRSTKVITAVGLTAGGVSSPCCSAAWCLPPGLRRTCSHQVPTRCPPWKAHGRSGTGYFVPGAGPFLSMRRHGRPPVARVQVRTSTGGGRGALTRHRSPRQCVIWQTI